MPWSLLKTVPHACVKNTSEGMMALEMVSTCKPREISRYSSSVE